MYKIQGLIIQSREISKKSNKNTLENYCDILKCHLKKLDSNYGYYSYALLEYFSSLQKVELFRLCENIVFLFANKYDLVANKTINNLKKEKKQNFSLSISNIDIDEIKNNLREDSKFNCDAKDVKTYSSFQKNNLSENEKGVNHLRSSIQYAVNNIIKESSKNKDKKNKIIYEAKEYNFFDRLEDVSLFFIKIF